MEIALRAQNNSHYQWGHPYLGYYQTEIMSNQPLREKDCTKKSRQGATTTKREREREACQHLRFKQKLDLKSTVQIYFWKLIFYWVGLLCPLETGQETPPEKPNSKKCRHIGERETSKFSIHCKLGSHFRGCFCPNSMDGIRGDRRLQQLKHRGAFSPFHLEFHRTSSTGKRCPTQTDFKLTTADWRRGNRTTVIEEDRITLLPSTTRKNHSQCPHQQ